jgi:LysR family nod box-dependent transcriptional activator
VKRRIRVTTFDFSTMATALVGTELVATMHTRLALACARRLPIRVLPLPCELPVLAECLQWHRFQENDPCHIWLRGIMLEVARALPPHADLPLATLSANAIETGASWTACGVPGLATA